MPLGDLQPDNHSFSLCPAAQLHPKETKKSAQMGLTTMTPAVILPTITWPFSVKKKRCCETEFLFLTHQHPHFRSRFPSDFLQLAAEKLYLNLICGYVLSIVLMLQKYHIMRGEYRHKILI